MIRTAGGESDAAAGGDSQVDLAAAEREGEDDEEAEAANAQVTFSLKPRQFPTTDWEASETRILNPMRMVTRSERQLCSSAWRHSSPCGGSGAQRLRLLMASTRYL